MLKEYLKIYSLISVILVLFPPVYTHNAIGWIYRAKFPNNLCFLFSISWGYKIDLSFLLIEFLVLTAIVTFIYLCFEDQIK